MISFDSSEIVNWTDRPDAHHVLPELVRRLILATIPLPEFLDMPSGSSVRMPGWDGLLSTSEGNAWVYSGASAWEFSCDNSPKQKADEDYEKRTANPQSVIASQTTFVVVTARRFGGKHKWMNERQQEGHWAGVRALDADDLTAWLEQAPAVAGWFARRAPWREAVTYRDTWPHEYVLSEKDGQQQLLEAVCERFRTGEGVSCRFFRMNNTYLFIGDYKYWLMTHWDDLEPGEDYVLNRARLYRDRRDFVIQPGDSGKPVDYPV